MPNGVASAGDQSARVPVWDPDRKPDEGMVRSWMHVAEGEPFELEETGEREYAVLARGVRSKVSWTWDGRVYLDGAYMDRWTWEYRFDMKKDCGECVKALKRLQASLGGHDSAVGSPAPRRKEKKP